MKMKAINERIKRYWIRKEHDNEDPTIQFPTLWERAENCITDIELICKKYEGSFDFEFNLRQLIKDCEAAIKNPKGSPSLKISSISGYLEGLKELITPERDLTLEEQLIEITDEIESLKSIQEGLKEIYLTKINKPFIEKVTKLIGNWGLITQNLTLTRCDGILENFIYPIKSVDECTIKSTGAMEFEVIQITDFDVTRTTTMFKEEDFKNCQFVPEKIAIDTINLRLNKILMNKHDFNLSINFREKLEKTIKDFEVQP